MMARRRRSEFAAAALAALSQPAAADILGAAVPGASAGRAQAALLVGLGLFAGAAAFLYAAGRRRFAEREAALAADLERLRFRLDRAELLLAARRQIVLIWRGESAEVEGDATLLSASPDIAPLVFASWLEPAAAQSLAGKVALLRADGRSFRLIVETPGGRHLDVEGAPAGGFAVVRIRDASEDRLEAIASRRREEEVRANFDSLWAMLEASPNPVWMRDGEGRLARVNGAYARAVEARDAAEAAGRGVELLEKPAREASAEARGKGDVWRARAPAVVVGERRLFEVIDAPAAAAAAVCAGMASDVTELQAALGVLERERQAHARTLDQLSTAVVIFDGAKRLVFHNAAYRQLWSLDQSWLDERPTDSEILERLRAARLLPEQTDFRVWKESLFSAYRSLETEEQAWHLPDGRTLRIVINPNPQGGVTYLFDDVTERFRLESQFNAAIRVQSETLDTLKEGVAVFGSDGRLKLFNPAFAQLWRLDHDALDGEPHIDHVAGLCAALFKDGDWSAIRSAVAGLQEQRLGFESRMTLRDGAVLDCAAAPLPDGATLVTFIDATAGVSVERALTERNQALVEAERLRNDFVHHVSYELRSPLTNIIGFVELLDGPAVGPLNDRQREYIGYVAKSTKELLAIINDILDLASIDADAMELSLEEIDIAGVVRAAADAMHVRAAEAGVVIRAIALADAGSFVADGKRVRQVLMNLISNAIGFSESGAAIDVAGLRRGDEIVFKVADRGSGVPPEVIDHIFDRFRTHTSGSRHRGVGLGLSIARSFVELHGGRILIDSVMGEGSTVTCIFPAHSARTNPLELLDCERHGG